MDVFMARQPIFDIKNNVFGYELLYRNNTVHNTFSGIDGDTATSSMITNTLFAFGINRLTNGKKAFINFTRNLLDREVATLLPKEFIVLEVLETVEPEPQIIEALKNLKKLGYMIALDDFVFSPKYQPFVELADIIKIDFLMGSTESRKEVSQYPAPENVIFLAEKIENIQQYNEAKRLGFKLFQGYYFSKPVIMQSRKEQPQKAVYLEILKNLNQPEIDFQRIAELIERDLTLTYEVLKMVNSAAFVRNNRVDSVRQALVLLGTEEIKKWTYLISLTIIGADKPAEIVSQSLLRAKFLEVLGTRMGYHGRQSEIFLMGLVSMMDVLLERPLDEVLNEISVSEDLQNALIRHDGPFSTIYNVMSFYERGDWDLMVPLTSGMSLSGSEVADCYYEALKWLAMYQNENRGDSII